MLLLGLLLCAGLCVPLYHYHYQWKWAVKRYQRELRAAGEELTLEKLLPPAVLPEKNGATFFHEASPALARRNELLEKNSPAALRMVASGKAIVSAREPDVRSDEVTNTWEQIEKALEPYQPAFRSLEQILTRPVLDFPLDYNRGFGILLPHIANLKNAVQRLSAAAECDLHHGNTEAAALKIRVALALSQGLEREPLLISQLVRIALAAIVVPHTWALLQANDVTEAQLAALQSDWHKLNFLQSAEAAVVMERAMSEATLEKMRRDRDEYRAVVNQWGGGSPMPSTPPSFAQITQTAFRESGLRSQEIRWRFAWSYPDEWRLLHGTQIVIETFRRVRAGAPFRKMLEEQQMRFRSLVIPTDGDTSRFGNNNIDMRSLFSQNLWALTNLPGKVENVAVSREVVLTAIALKRYHLRHHAYPPNLAALVPEFLPAMPLDLIDAAPLRYRRQEASFLLYSVGEDGNDDGGDARPVPEASSSRTRNLYWLRGRDWVWPQPASADEVAEFYARKRGGSPGEALRQRYRPPSGGR
jgi:hypothetical protein